MGNGYDFRTVTPPVDSAKFMSNALTQLNQRMPYQMPAGMKQVGNIDVNHRPVITNADGSKSTIFSATIPVDANGDVWKGTYETAPHYALAPTIVNGKFLTADGKMPKELLEGSKATADQKATARGALEDAARDYYQKSKQHLGIFNSDQAASEFANATHAWEANGTNEKVVLPFQAGMTMSGWGE